MKKILKLMVLILWLGFIYSMSAQNGETSASLSGGLLAYLHLPPSFSFIIRKTAHYLEYFILAMLIKWNFPKYHFEVLIACFIFAAGDEFHQLFVSGRAGRLMDVAIDTVGSGCFLALYRLLKRND